ncbi:hypothetical protein [Anaeroplasma bactoclasticum]|jgi:hypothetical protein|uniref:hypothetical protein n=1 Tax=Anaeroplasma bactoclasticum TaxID=2088 RepID=UPI0013C36497|nr:hypothetical protein [Anaeroplasma bactoclasticum]
MNQDFKSLTHDIIISDNFQKMKQYIHHGHISAYKHSITVAYLVYKHYKKRKRKR